MTLPAVPADCPDWWTWECERCGALHESHEPRQDDEGCLWCDSTPERAE